MRVFPRSFLFNIHRLSVNKITLNLSGSLESRNLFSKAYLSVVYILLFNSSSHCKGCCHEQSEFDSAAANLVQTQTC